VARQIAKSVRERPRLILASSLQNKNVDLSHVCAFNASRQPIGRNRPAIAAANNDNVYRLFLSSKIARIVEPTAPTGGMIR
jgi:hypothetical protein